MLVHLSNTSPYVCDLNRGPIEQANRMASAPTKKATALLEQKESVPKSSRTPLKLLAPDEVPRDSTVPTTDINASLQPVWYTEQTIVDDHYNQQEDIASIIQQQQGKSPITRTTLTRSMLPPIPSESPSIIEEELPNQPSLMHKSSTFTIEPSINVNSSLNDSEKENVIKDNTTNQIIPPSDDSFRALEHLLGLNSPTTARESRKTNRDTLSLTVVTPTDIINSTTTSLRMSYGPKNGSDSLPSSQDIPTMPTIESITSTNPPSFLMDNTALNEEQPSIGTTTMNQQTSFDITDNDTIKDDIDNSDETNFSFELNDFPNNSKNESTVNVPEPAPPMITIRAPTCADVAYRALIKPRSGGRISQPVKADSPLAKPNKFRSSAPTSRILRSSCRRISTDSASQNSIMKEQPSSNTECFVNETETNTNPQMELVQVVSVPEEDENEQEKTTSITLNLTSSKLTEEINQNTSIPPEKISTPTKPLMSLLSREYTYNTPKRRSSERRRSMLNSSRATPIQQQQTTINEEEFSSPAIASKSMLGILLTKPTAAEPSVLQKTLTTSVSPAPVRASTRAKNSPLIASKSMLGILLTKPTDAEPNLTTAIAPSPIRTSTRRTINKEVTNSPSIASKSMLEILLTKPTEAERNLTTSIAPSPVRTSTRRTINKEVTNSPSIASKSMLEILLTKPTEAEANLTTSIAPSPVQTSTRKSGRLSTNPTPRVSINPLHSSTPSTTRNKSLQMVSIGEQEQVSTTVPQQINIEIQEEQQDIEMIPLNDTEESIQQSSTAHTIETGVQTTPSLDVSSRRHLNKIQQQTTPIVQMNKSSSIVIFNEQQQQQRLTPLQTKVIMNVQRNVRFQLTPATDARLVAKEKLEENLRGLKPDIIINPTPIIPVPKQETIISVPIKKVTKRKKKITSKKRKVAPTKKVEPKKQPIQKKSRQPQKEKTIKQKKPIPSTKDSKKKLVQRTKVSKKKPIPSKDSKKKPEVVPPTKRTQRKQPIPKVVPPTKRTERKQPIPEVVPPTKRAQRKERISAVVPPTKPAQRKSIPKVVPPIKRASRKRTTEVTTNPIEPIAKRAKTSKSVEVLPPPPTSKPLKTRSGSTNNKKIIPEPIEQQPGTRSRSINNKKNISESIERQSKTKDTTPTIKTSKRRLQSVEKNEGLKKKAKEENIQSIPAVQNFELSQEERQKIEALNIAGLKSRLNTHKQDIPKGAKKADLIALLIKIETNLLKERKEAEAAAPTVNTTAMTTRRRKK